MSQLEELLQHCTVKLSLPGQLGWGTGFFVGPGLILTCAHVVKRSPGMVQVAWRGRTLEAVVERSLSDPYDLALLRVELMGEVKPPCVWLDEAVQSRDPLYLFGYPDEGDRLGEPRTFNCDGVTGSEVGSILFNLGQVRPGMSGSALLNQRTKKVCGIVKFTRDRSSDLGGGAISTRVILEQFPELRSLQQEFHGRDRRWSELLAQGSEIDCRAYLGAIATTYAKWWQYYTLTDAEGKQRQEKESSPLFDFGLMVQTVVKETQDARSQETPEGEKPEKEKIERFSVLDGLRTYVDRHRQVLLVGQPGSGKSTALARLMLEEATAQIAADNSARIPILVELRYWQSFIEDLIRNALTRHGFEIAPEHLETAIARSLILFDGVNELPSETARTQLSAFRRNHPNGAMIFTTRDLSLGGDLGLEHKLEMQPLTEPQMRAFIRAYIPDQAEAMLRQLKDRVREFGQTPLLLWMLCSVFQQTQTIPQNLGGVFRAFTQSYEQRLKQDVVIESDLAWWPPVLQQLAWVMMQGQKPTELRVAIPRGEAVGAIGQFLTGKVPYAEDFARKCLRDLQKYHLIQAGTNPDELEFRHQLLQEYYAAESLLQRLPDFSDAQLKREYLNYLKWTEPVALMLALVNDEAKALRVVQLALEVDLRLGARLAGEVKREFQVRTVDLIQQHHTAMQLPSWLLVQLLDLSHSEAAIAGLLKALEDSDNEVRESAASALDEIGSEAAIAGLLKAIEDLDCDVRRSAADALGKIGSEAAILGLFKALEDSIWFVRWSAAKALGKIGTEAVIPGLLKTVEDSDRDVRWGAIDALGNIGSKTAIPGLLKAIEDSDCAVRWSTAFALGNIGSETAVPSLLKAIEDSDSNVRWSTASALGKIGSETAIPSLLKAIEDSSSPVRRRATEALGKIGTEAVILGLLKGCDQNLMLSLYEAKAILIDFRPELLPTPVRIT